MISLEKLKILTPLQKVPKNVEDLGKLMLLPKSNKLPNLVTLVPRRKKATFKFLSLSRIFRTDTKC